MSAASATLTPWTASVVKMAYPGVSIRLSLQSRWWAYASASPIVIFRSTASSSKSVTAVPLSTLPSRLTALASYRMAEIRVVFPVEE